MQNQLKLAKRLALQKAIPTKKKKINDLPLSTEMTNWLKSTFDDVDDHGYLNENISSVLSQPLDAMSVFCPTGSIVSSKFSALRIPKEDDQYIRPAEDTASASSSADLKTGLLRNHVGVGEAVNRMEVLWLQRRAKFEKEEGNLNKAFETLDEAIKIHIGTDNYAEARLADDVISSDPSELLKVIEKEFFVYDQRSHLKAGRLQRWYHKIYQRKYIASTKISSLFRRFLIRRKIWQQNHLRIKCAKLLQRRFRIHLKRMNALATKIKRWFRLHQTMRDYQRQLYDYRAARKIQKIYRGYVGRHLASIRYQQIVCSSIIQRNARGYILRQKRSFAISFFHRIAYVAARRIQCKVRCNQAIAKAQLTLLEQIILEEKRQQRERDIRNEAIRIEIRRTKFYLKTAAGKIHLEAAKAAIKARDGKFQQIQNMLMKQDILAHNALVAYELFDVDNSGDMTMDDLMSLLKELCISVTPDELKEMSDELLIDNTGTMDFNTFLDLYSEGGLTKYGLTITATMKKRYMRLQKKLKDYSGYTLRQRAVKELLRHRCTWIHDTVTAMYRTTNPPKYQCCQCLRPFVLFTDYYVHFGADRKCGVTGDKALYYPRFWVQEDWLKQRQCEQEIIRSRNESPFVEQKKLLAKFADIALQQDRALSKFLTQIQRRARLVYFERMTDTGRSQIPSKMIMEIADVCQDNQLYPPVAHIVAKYTGHPLPKEWVQEDIWSLKGLEGWLQREVDEPGGLHGGKKGVIDRHLGSAGLMGRLAKWRDAGVMSKICVYGLRSILVSLEAALIALREYRSTQPRKYV